jgi:hypothetical protein
MPVILATLEAEIRRIEVPSQPGQIVLEILSRKTLHKNRAGGVAQDEDPESEPQYHKKRKRERESHHLFNHSLLANTANAEFAPLA